MQSSSLTLQDSHDGRTSVVNVPLPTERLRVLAPGYSSCVPSSFPLSAQCNLLSYSIATSKSAKESKSVKKDLAPVPVPTATPVTTTTATTTVTMPTGVTAAMPNSTSGTTVASTAGAGLAASTASAGLAASATGAAETIASAPAPNQASVQPSSANPAPTSAPASGSTNPTVPKTESAPAVLEEMLVGKGKDVECRVGIANGLKVLRERKLLGQNIYSGRYKDKTKEGELEKFAKAGMKGGEKYDLDYRDEKGLRMTLKEAFRYQCRIFHGIKQSKRKREKTILKKAKEHNKLLMDQVKDNKLMQALAKSQLVRKEPYLVLDAKRPSIL